MFALLRKRIVVDTSSEEIRRVTTILERNKIKYDIRSKRTRARHGHAMMIEK